MQIYEQLLDRDFDWALREGSLHFEEKNAVHRALHKITGKLNQLGVPYAVAGAMALFRHGYRRFTEDVDILVTRDGLQLIHEQLEGLGYVPPFSGSKNLRDADTGVRIEFIVTGDYPGDGKPKPVAFPDPHDAHVELDGIRFLNLVTLVELKLASGMTGAGRHKDLGDVEELIAALNLSVNFADQLDPFVRDKFVELWHGVQERRLEP